MPIPVACTCGARFAAQDQLAGRTVKCPKCQSPLTIPAGAPAAPQFPATPAPFPTAPAPFAAGPAAYGAPPAGNDLFSQAGLHAAPAGSLPCPGCGKPLNPGVVVCIGCGYNVKLGRRMGTINLDRPEASGGLGGHGGHGDAAAALLAKAEVAIVEEREYEASKGKEGFPWWGYLCILFGLIGFTVLMMSLPVETAYTASAWIIIIGCGIVNMYLSIRLIMIAFEEGTSTGLLYLFVPFYSLYFVFTRWDKCGGLFIYSFTIGFVSNVVSQILIYLANMPAGVE